MVRVHLWTQVWIYKNMITKYESFSNPFFLNEGIKAGLDKKDFSKILGTALFESNSDKALLEKAYSVYELGLLYENRKEWFIDDSPIYNLESDGHQILFKGGNLFIVTNESFKILNEQFWDEVSSAWNSVTASASAAASSAASSAASTWNSLSDGAKKAFEFSKKITSAGVEFVKSDPWTCGAIFLQLLSGIVAFIPAAGQATGPVMLGLAGAIEIYLGSKKMIKAWDKFSTIDVSKTAKATQSFSEGAPLVIAGIVSIMLGLNDVITAPKAAVPAAGATSTALHAAANKWSSTFAGGLAHHAEHFIVDVAGKAATKVGPALSAPISKFMNKGGSAVAATMVSILMMKVGDGVLGSYFDIVLDGMRLLSQSFSFVLSLPTKASEALNKLIKSADSPLAQVLIAPLKYIIEPVVKFIGKIVDTHIKPFVDSATEYFTTLRQQSKTLKSYSNEIKTESPRPLVKNAVGKTKEKPIQVSKEDANKIKTLPKVKESLIIQRFDSFGMV